MAQGAYAPGQPAYGAPQAGATSDPAYAGGMPGQYPQEQYPQAQRAQEKPRRLSRREQKAAAKEVAGRKKAVEAQAKATRKSLKAEMNEEAQRQKKEAKALRTARDGAKSVYELLGFDLMYQDGTCEVEKGLFSQTLAFSDISYQSASYEAQESYFKEYAGVFDYCSSDTYVQINVINTKLPSDKIGRESFFNETGTAEIDDYISEYNQILNNKKLEGVSNLERNRYMTFTVQAESYEKALPELARKRSDFTAALSKLGCRVEKLDGEQRLALISNQLRPGKPFSIDYDELLINGLTAKDYVCPQSLDFKPEGLTSAFQSESLWCQALTFRKFGSQLSDTAIADIADLPMPLNVSLHVQALDKSKSTDFVLNRLAWIDKDIIEYQRKAVRQGFDYQLLPQELSYSKNEAEELLDQMQNLGQRLCVFSGVVYTYAETYEKLADQVKQIMSVGRKNAIELDTLDCQQPQGLNTALPLGAARIEQQRYMTTSQVAMMVPFATQELSQPGGGYYGQNKVSQNLILMNRSLLAAPMGFVLGKPGSGKSFAVKREITNTFLAHPEDEIIIVDPQGEYPPLVNALGGTAFNLSPGATGDHINVFDFFAGSYDVTGEDPTLFKSEAIMAIASVVMGRGDTGITPEERTIIDRCVRLTYAEFEDADRAPVLGDFYRILKEQPEEEAARLVTGFELYVEGGLSYFNHETSVELDKRIVSFSFKQLGDNMRIFAMLVILDLAYNRMLANFNKGIRTWLYIDEVQSLFSISSVVAYFDKFWAEGRKFNLIPTGITQTVERILNHPVAKLLLSNSDYLMLLKQSDTDRKTLTAILGLSEQQAEYIDRSTNPGEGLLIAGEAVVPFKDDWPHGKLYTLWNTKPDEIAADKKAKWQQKQAEAQNKEATPEEQVAAMKASFDAERVQLTSRIGELEAALAAARKAREDAVSAADAAGFAAGGAAQAQSEEAASVAGAPADSAVDAGAAVPAWSGQGIENAGASPVWAGGAASAEAFESESAEKPASAATSTPVWGSGVAQARVASAEEPASAPNAAPAWSDPSLSGAIPAWGAQPAAAAPAWAPGEQEQDSRPAWAS